MLPKLSVRMDRFEQVPAALVHIYAVIDDFSEFWRDVFAPKYLSDVRRNIEEEGELVRPKWPATTADYDEWKERATGSNKMGVFTGRMFSNMDAGSATMNIRANKHSLEITSTDRTAHFFTRQGRLLFPQLQWLGLEGYRQLLNDWLEFRMGPELGKQRIEPLDIGHVPVPRGGARMARTPKKSSQIHVGSGRPKRKVKVTDKLREAAAKARAGRATKRESAKKVLGAAAAARQARKEALKMAGERYKLYKTPDTDYAFGGGKKKKKKKNWFFDEEP